MFLSNTPTHSLYPIHPLLFILECLVVYVPNNTRWTFPLSIEPASPHDLKVGSAMMALSSWMINHHKINTYSLKQKKGMVRWEKTKGLESKNWAKRPTWNKRVKLHKLNTRVKNDVNIPIDWKYILLPSESRGKFIH